MRLHRLHQHLRGLHASAPSHPHDVNRLIAPSLDARLALAALGRITFKGQPLADGLVAPMRESRLSDGTGALQANLDTDGYVLLRGALPSDVAARARAEVFTTLAGVSEIRRDPAAGGSPFDGIVTGESTRHELYPDEESLGSFWRSVSEGPELRSATHGAALRAAVATVIGEAATPHDYLYVRCVAPGSGKQTDLHYDHVFFGTRLKRRETLLTCWLALTETSPVDGGLFVVENSHRFADCLSQIEGVEAVRVEGHPSKDPPWVNDADYLVEMERLGRVAPSRATHMDWEDAPAFAASRGSHLLTAAGSFKCGCSRLGLRLRAILIASNTVSIRSAGGLMTVSLCMQAWRHRPVLAVVDAWKL